jgi:hypothetical protein
MRIAAVSRLLAGAGARRSRRQVQFDGWMLLMQDGVVLNRAAMSKFGVHVGDITVSFRRGGS